MGWHHCRVGWNQQDIVKSESFLKNTHGSDPALKIKALHYKVWLRCGKLLSRKCPKAFIFSKKYFFMLSIFYKLSSANPRTTYPQSTTCNTSVNFYSANWVFIVQIMTNQRLVLSVSQLNADVNQLLMQGFPALWVEGEISNLSRPSSGHLYFVLKDSQAQLRCALFRPKALGLRIKAENGSKVSTNSLWNAWKQWAKVSCNAALKSWNSG